MKDYKIAMPANPDLQDLVIQKFISVYDNLVTMIYCFYKFNDIEVFPIGSWDDFRDCSWPEITITDFLKMPEKNLGKKYLPRWVLNSAMNNTPIMFIPIDKKEWVKGILSHITVYLSGGKDVLCFYMEGGIKAEYIAKLDNNFLGSSKGVIDSISSEDLKNYDISNIPGCGYKEK